MKRILLPLIAALAFPTAVNATNYVECEAIYSLIARTENQKLPLALVADILGTSKKFVNSWSEKKLKAIIDKKNGKKYFHYFSNYSK